VNHNKNIFKKNILLTESEPMSELDSCRSWSDDDDDDDDDDGNDGGND
jgi:hypothetical protein